MFAAAKNIFARTRKDPRMNVQCQDIDRLLSVIQAPSTIKNIRKQFYRAPIALDVHDDILWAGVDLSGCDRIRHFGGQEQLPLPEDSPTHPRRLANIDDGKFRFIHITIHADFHTYVHIPLDMHLYLRLHVPLHLFVHVHIKGGEVRILGVISPSGAGLA
jgi:hypothetical protein